MGFFLGMKYGVHDIHLVDIHPPCLQSIQETNKHNNLNFKFYLSDTFDNYDGPKVDFICSILHIWNRSEKNILKIMTQGYG